MILLLGHVPLKWPPFKDPEVFDYLYFEEEEDLAIGLATTLVEHRDKAPIYYFFFMISRRLKQTD